MTPAALENLLCSLAPEFLATRPYVVLTSAQELGEFTVPGNRLWGMHGQMLDLTLREQLGDRWRGRAPLLLVDNLQIARNIISMDGVKDIAPELVAERVLATVIHEAAHALEYPFSLCEPSAEFVKLAQAETVRHLATTPAEIEADRDPWHAHLASFIRILLHLLHRAEMLGVPVVTRLAFNASDYALSGIHAYQAALGDEPAQMAGESFEAIRETEMPAEFLSLWRADIATFYKSKFAKERTS